MRYLLIVFFFLFCGTHAFSQENDFNTIFMYVATELTHADPERAIAVADSLYKNSSDKKHKISALMLASNVYYRKGELKESLSYTNKAQGIAEEIKDYDWQIRIQGFYASMYRSIRFFDQSMTHLKQVEDLLPKLNDSKKRAVISVLNAQEQAYLYHSTKEWDKVIPTLKKAEVYYSEIKDSKSGGLHISNSEELKARILVEEKRYDEGYEAYQNVLEVLEPYNFSEYPVYGYVYIGLAKILYNRDKDTLQATKYMNKAKPIVDASNMVDLKIYYNSSLRKYYADVQQWDKYQEKDLLLKELKTELNTNVNGMLTNLFGEIRTENSVNKASSRLFLISTFTLLAILILFSLIALFRRRKNNLRVREILRELERLKAQSIPSIEIEKIAKETASKDALINLMAPDTLKDIIEKLGSFEKEELYLSSTFSIEDLSAYCNSNVRYVSEVIRNIKNENFASYINKLRVMYMAERLSDKKEYRKYKIAHLAEIAGFSSHSKFSLEFKKVFNLSPSTFIKNLP